MNFSSCQLSTHPLQSHLHFEHVILLFKDTTVYEMKSKLLCLTFKVLQTIFSIFSSTPLLTFCSTLARTLPGPLPPKSQPTAFAQASSCIWPSFPYTSGYWGTGYSFLFLIHTYVYMHTYICIYRLSNKRNIKLPYLHYTHKPRPPDNQDQVCKLAQPR